MRYNDRRYNAQRYNINGVYYATSISDTVAPTEFETASVIKTLFDSMSESDTIAFGADLSLLDSIFSDDAIRIDFTNKALNDTIKLTDWLSIKRTNNGEWFN